jgi:hypothetical protein
MANSTINVADEKRAEFACSLINKGKRLGLLTDALVGGATSFQDLLDDIRTVANSATLHPEVRHIFDALLGELKWAYGMDIITEALTLLLSTVNTASATTDLRYLFSSLVQNPQFDATREDYVAAAFGSTSY